VKGVRNSFNFITMKNKNRSNLTNLLKTHQLIGLIILCSLSMSYSIQANGNTISSWAEMIHEDYKNSDSSSLNTVIDSQCLISDSISAYLFKSNPLHEGINASEIFIENGIPIKNLCANMFCNADGSVSIGGSEKAAGYKLSVKGKVIAVGIKVAQSSSSSWPDYVFQDGYQLQSLPKLKKFIKVNGHLPGVASSKVVAKKGIDAGDMSAILLQKTEELTLHLIQLDERLRKLETQQSSKQD
jgi:hypothetical protein